MADDTDISDGLGAGRGGAALELSASYEPDDDRAARALLLILGVPAEEVERVVGEMALESRLEM